MKTKRVLFFSLGRALVSIGAVGVVLPVLPTTPFIIAAAACFAKSSKRAEKWISNNRYVGSYIENYKNNQGVPISVKKIVSSFLGYAEYNFCFYRYSFYVYFFVYCWNMC